MYGSLARPEHPEKPEDFNQRFLLKYIVDNNMLFFRITDHKKVSKARH